MSLFRPMLASEANAEKLRFPLLASPKLDGIRAIVRCGAVMSRSNKLIPNKYVQSLFRQYEHYDGELIVGDPTSHSVYRDTTSGVMRVEGEPDVRFFVFDHIETLNHSYAKRSKLLKSTPRVIVHEQVLITDADHLLQYEELALSKGYEGLILRDQSAPYKMGRSTVAEGYLLKLKRFLDSEALVIGFEERMHNGNEAKTNELGRTSRSSHKANKVGRGDLGALVVRNAEGVEFNIGTGFSDAERASVWNQRDAYLGKLAKFKYFPVGIKEAPRHPVFLGWRDARDM